MEILLDDNETAIRGDYIVRAVLRTDLVPIPLSLELDVRVDQDSAERFDVGKSLFLGNGDELEIIKAEYLQKGLATGGTLAAHRRVVAVLKAVAEVSYLKDKAIIKRDATLSDIYKACGATLKGIEGDFPVPRFVCLAGEVPTYHIARALQEAGGVVRWAEGKLAFKRVADLFDQEPVETLVPGATEDVASGFLERHDIPFFYSVDDDGEYVYGAREKTRTARFHPGAAEMDLRQMTDVLILSKRARLKYTEVLNAGDLVEIEEQDPLVILTAATLFAAAADGQQSRQLTRVWLGKRLELN